jgi:hypothetical protein
MKLRIFYLTLFFSFTTFAEMYEREVSFVTKGIAALKKDITAETKNVCIELYHKDIEQDHVSFYDNQGFEILVKYRENKFDIAAKKIIEGIHRGNAYLLSLDLIGVYSIDGASKQYYSFKNMSIETLQNKNSILVFSPSKISTCASSYPNYEPIIKEYKDKFFLPLEPTRAMF